MCRSAQKTQEAGQGRAGQGMAGQGIKGKYGWRFAVGLRSGLNLLVKKVLACAC